jgi:hypothetical protein
VPVVPVVHALALALLLSPKRAEKSKFVESLFIMFVFHSLDKIDFADNQNLTTDK